MADLHKAIRAIHSSVVNVNGDTEETITATDNNGDNVTFISPTYDQFRVEVIIQGCNFSKFFGERINFELRGLNKLKSKFGCKKSGSIS